MSRSPARRFRRAVILSWPDVAASADWSSTGMNLVIHEFAHKIDMRSGEANGSRRCMLKCRRARGKRQ